MSAALTMLVAMHVATFSVLPTYLIFEIVLLPAVAKSKKLGGMNRCWQKLWVANCGQTAADSDLVTVDGL